VVRAALQAAEEAHTPLLFAATLNQVDRGGGYTGWTPQRFASLVKAEAEHLDVRVPLVLGLDHGGPWKKDVHVQEEWSYRETYDAVVGSLEACIDAGYELLHLDPTVDRRLPPGTPVPIPAIVARTVQLMQHAERYRKMRDAPPLAYEVGTEEVGGGLQSEQRFGAYLRELRTALDRHALPHPSFVVGDVGTTLDSAHVNASRAAALTRQAQDEVGAVLKGHYTDEVNNLAAYPLSGMGGANVGPGLAAAEYDALTDLVDLESRLDADSGFLTSLRNAIVNSGRWQKWLHPEEEGLPFDALPADRQRWLVRTGSRYVWAAPEVQAARKRLYANVASCRNAEAFVHWRVRTDILRYMHAFHLVDLQETVAGTLETMKPATA
jgi:tagatose-1,6-bisphosphate aldolase non-catalytic subunit AgaZ/GatZ